MFAIPAEQDLGAGLVGLVEHAMPDGPAWRVRLRLDEVGARIVTARWEWDLQPPVIGSPLAVVVVPGTLRFFTSSGHAVDRHPRATPRRAEPAPPEPSTTIEVDAEPPVDAPGNSNGPANGTANGNGAANASGTANGNGHLPSETLPLQPPAPTDAEVRHHELPPVD